MRAGLAALLVVAGLVVETPAAHAVAGPDLQVAFTGVPEWVKPGTTATFPIEVRNVGTQATSGLVTVTIDMFSSNPRASGSGWNCVADADFMQVVCTRLTSVAPGAVLPIINAKGDVEDEYPFTFDMSVGIENDSDVDANNDSAEASANVRPQFGLAAVLTPPDHELGSGQAFSYSARIDNIGYKSVNSEITVDFTADGADVEASGQGWTCDNEFQQCVTNADISSLASSKPITFEATVTGAPGGTVALEAILWNDDDETPDDDIADASLPIATVADTTAPTDAAVTGVTPPVVRTTRAIDVAWSATDDVGIDHYDVQSRVTRWDSAVGPWTTWKSGTTATGARYTGTYGRTYCFRVHGVDAFGNTSAWSPLKCTAVPLRAIDLSYTGTWTTQSREGAFTGSVRRSTVTGSKATKGNVRAERLALVVSKGPGSGSVRVRWNGTSLGTFSLYSSTAKSAQIVTVKTFAAAQTGTVTIEVTSSGKAVLLEGLAVYRD